MDNYLRQLKTSFATDSPSAHFQLHLILKEEDTVCCISLYPYLLLYQKCLGTPFHPCHDIVVEDVDTTYSPFDTRPLIGTIVGCISYLNSDSYNLIHLFAEEEDFLSFLKGMHSTLLITNTATSVVLR